MMMMLFQTMVHPMVREASTNCGLSIQTIQTHLFKKKMLKLCYTRQYVRHFLCIDERYVFNSPDASFSKPLHYIIFIIGVIPLEE